MEFPLYFFLVPLFVIIFFVYQLFFTTSNTQKKLLPPSPRKLPIIGNLHQLGSNPHRSLKKLSEKYGPIMLLHLGSKPVLVASSAEVARDIMKTHDLVWSNRPKFSIADGVYYGSKDVAFSSYGEYWRQIRSITVLHLLSNKRVQSYRDVREDETSNMIDKIRKECDSSDNSVIDLRDVLCSLTHNIINRVTLGRTYDERESGIDVKALIEEHLELLGVFNIGDYIPWLKWVSKINGLDMRVNKVAKDLDAFLENVIEEHIIIRNKKGDCRAGEGKDFVDVLLELQNGKETGFPLQRDSLKAIVLDSVISGTDTIYITLEWIMTELMRHPRAMKKLQNEVRGVAKGKAKITEDDLGNMKYLKTVVKETLRLHSPAPLLIARESMEDVNLLGYHIPAKTQLLINAWAIGRDPLSWEDPEKYQPERFLNCDIDVKGLNFELIPFGAGRRGCPGISFSIMVIELALARLVHKFNFSFPKGIKKENLDMTECTGITIHRKSPLLVMATPWSN